MIHFKIIEWVIKKSININNLKKIFLLFLLGGGKGGPIWND